MQPVQDLELALLALILMAPIIASLLEVVGRDLHEPLGLAGHPMQAARLLCAAVLQPSRSCRPSATMGLTLPAQVQAGL